MYTVQEIESMCGDARLARALQAGLVECASLQEGVVGKALSIAALVIGTIFSGCAGNHQPQVELKQVSLDEPATADSVTRLAMEIAEGINDEMKDSTSVTSTQAWQAATDIYKKLVGEKKQALANSFARTINRETQELFNAPPCCDERKYDNTEQPEQDHGPVYDEETGMMEYN